MQLTPNSGFVEIEKASAALKNHQAVEFCGRYVYGTIEYDSISTNFSVQLFRNGNYNKTLKDISLFRLIDEIRVHFGNE